MESPHGIPAALGRGLKGGAGTTIGVSSGPRERRNLGPFPSASGIYIGNSLLNLERTRARRVESLGDYKSSAPQIGEQLCHATVLRLHRGV